MTVQAGVEAELPFLRSEANARMTSTATVRRRTSLQAQDESDGARSPVWDDVQTNIPCRIVPHGSSRRVDVGDVQTQQATPRIDFPWDTQDLADGDYIDVTAGEWAGSVYRIEEAVKGDQRTARRVPVVEADRPTEWTP